MKTCLAFLACLAATAGVFAALAEFAPVNDRPRFIGGKWQPAPNIAR